MNRRKRFLCIFAILIVLPMLVTKCRYNPEIECKEGYVTLKAKMDKQYQNATITWRGKMIEETEPPEIHREYCIDTTPPKQDNDSLDILSSPPDVASFSEKTLHIGVWDSTMTVVGDECPYTIVCGHEIFSGGGQEIEFALTGCTSDEGLRHHRLQTDFSNDQSGMEPCNWTERWDSANSDWVVVNGELRGNQTVSDNRLLNWDIVPTDEPDIEILAKVLTHAKSPAAHAQLHLRSSGAAADTRRSYLAGLVRSSGVDKLEIRKHIGNAFPTLGDYDFGYSTNAWYWIRFRAQGNNLQAKVWADGTSEPGGWHIVVTDNEIFSGGWVGVGTYEANDDPYFGWFSVGFGGNSAGPSP